MEPSVATAMASYLRSIADWRRQRYQDDLRDARNLRSAAALDDFATYIEGLPADDPRLKRLNRVAMEGERFAPGQQTSYEIGRFRFFSEEATIEGFLDRVVELAEADAGEQGKFGGPQVPGDDPWH